MPSELAIRAVHQGGMRFEAACGEHRVSLDYPLQPGPTAGMKPLEMLLSSLAACAGSTVALLLGRMKQPLKGLEVRVRASRRDEHPTVLTKIDMEFLLSGQGLDPAAVSRALAQAEERLCPVWAMLKSGTAIAATFKIDA